MLFFLKVLLAAVLVVVAIIIGIAWWFKRSLLRATNDYTTAAGRLNPDRLKPARTRLQSTAEPMLDDDALALWQTVCTLGFRHAGDFESEVALRLGQHVSLPMQAAVVQTGLGDAYFVCLAVGSDRSLVAVTTEATASVQLGKMHWIAAPQMSPADALEHLQAQIGGRELLTLNPAQFCSAWQQAHAARMDRVLARPPQREQIEREVASAGDPPDDALVDTAYELARSHWQTEVADAALDHYRRQSKIDAVTWERIAPEVHVVHGHVDRGDVDEMLITNEFGEQLLQQCVDQGFSGIDLYEQVRSRLPQQTHRLVGEVARPLRALIYAPDETTPGAKSGQYFYRASGDGKTTHGAVIATSSRDAKRQLANMGLSQIEIVNEPSALVSETDLDWGDPELARAAAEASEHTVVASALHGLMINSWIWGPPALLLAWSLYSGAPYTGGDYAVFAYAAVAAAVMTFMIIPMLVYDLFQRARKNARWRTASVLLTLFRVINVFPGIDKNMLVLERLKIKAAQGEERESLDTWAAHRAQMTEADYQGGLSMLYDAMGDHDGMIEAQRATVLAEPPSIEMASVDLALSLARRGDADEARALLSDVAREDLSELVSCGYYLAQGLLAAHGEEHQQALKLYERALERLVDYKSNPQIELLSSEIKACAAISLGHVGETQNARALWNSVWPLLSAHRSAHYLKARYDSSA